jgi:hypothetical protein
MTPSAFTRGMRLDARRRSTASRTLKTCAREPLLPASTTTRYRGSSSPSRGDDDGDDDEDDDEDASDDDDDDDDGDGVTRHTIHARRRRGSVVVRARCRRARASRRSARASRSIAASRDGEEEEGPAGGFVDGAPRPDAVCIAPSAARVAVSSKAPEEAAGRPTAGAGGLARARVDRPRAEREPRAAPKIRSRDRRTVCNRDARRSP